MTWLLAITTMSAFAQQATVTGPDSFLKVNVSVKQGIPIYSVTYKDKTILEDSPLGFVANVGDFSRDMTFTGQKENKIDKTMLVARLKGYLDGLPPKTRRRIVLAMLAAFAVLAIYTFGKAVYDIGRNGGSRIVTDHAGQVGLSVKP